MYEQWRTIEDTCSSKNGVTFGGCTWSRQRTAIAPSAPGLAHSAAAANLLGDVLGKWQRACACRHRSVAQRPLVRHCLVRWGGKQTCPSYSSATQKKGNSLEWCITCIFHRQGDDTYRHSACFQGPTCSLIYMCTCSFLWCSDIQHSYRSRAAGTHWCLWNMQYVSRGTSGAFPDYEAMFFFCWETPSEPLHKTRCKYRYQTRCVALHIEYTDV